MARDRARPRRNQPEELSERAVGESPVIEYDPDAPPSGSESPVVTEAADTEDTIAVPAAWIAAQEELEERLRTNEAFATQEAVETEDYDAPADRVLGTGIGFRMFNGVLSPEVTLKVYVAEKSTEGVSGILEALPQTVGDLPVDVEEVGDIVPQMYTARYTRPVRCGVSVGHPKVTAGTLGCLVVLNNNKLCILSNNHVLANENDAQIGDVIIQPGKADGGRPVGVADRIGLLEHFVRINVQGPNRVDAAVAWTTFGNVDPQHVTYTLNPTAVTPRLGMTVKKNGRTTQATLGTITDMNVNISVRYRPGVAEFRGQIGIRGVGGVFSRGGDSGSLIVTANSNQPVGLLFAGRQDNTVTFANPIGEVIQALGIKRFVNQRG